MGFSCSLYFHWTSNIKIKTHILVSLGLNDLKDLFQPVWFCNSVSLVDRSQHFLPDCGYLRIFAEVCTLFVALHWLHSRTGFAGMLRHFPALQVRLSLQLSWLQCSSDKISAGQGCLNRIKAAFPSFPVGLMEVQAPSSSSWTTPIKGNQITPFPCSAERPCLPPLLF